MSDSGTCSKGGERSCYDTVDFVSMRVMFDAQVRALPRIRVPSR